MKQLISVIILFIAFGCGNSNNHDPKSVFVESDYVLIKTDSIKNVVTKKTFAYKLDTARKLTIEYWDNGNKMQKEFSYKGQLDGRREMYDIDEKVMATDSFHNGEQISSK
ncbi:hypothetical protein [Ferruginibacter profundus]